ncbi:nucleotidyltransferase domain-containing protein, partial [Raoultella terrigena]|uniref:nucleotidyltransferase domain-containing protein n=1 Tax=Raoultella terrigena TaxID=577 RepID=UPI0015F2BA11
GRQEVARRLEAKPTRGRETVTALAFLIDQILRLLYDATTHHLYPASNRSTGERIALIAVGGYGRGEMAPHSDVDLMALVPGRLDPADAALVEDLLYLLWDLKLKVGHATRSVSETLRLAREDMTIRTALLE